MSLCYLCSSPGTVPCPGCDKVSCCPEHLRLHHRDEEGVCYPWGVEELPGVGRAMVATRDLAAGEVIFRESPLVQGPASEPKQPVCLNCYSRVSLDYLCPDCSYPMCRTECSQAREHEEECAVLRRGPPPSFGEDSEAYHCVLPLKLLLLARSSPNLSSLAAQLMDHEEERRGGDDWKTTERTVVHHLLQGCDMAKEGVTQEQVRRAVGVLEVNCYEVHTFTSCGFRGCYPAASLLSHSCVANSRHLWGTLPPYLNTCIATVPIRKGQEVVTSYQQPTTCFSRRRPKLKAGWYFDCTCRRCLSPTELSSHMNTLVCPHCNNPSLFQGPQGWKSVKCDLGCLTLLEAETRVEGLLQQCRELAGGLDRYNTGLWLQLEQEAIRLVHTQHEVCVEIAKFSVPVLCRGPGLLTSNFPLDLVRKKLSLARRHLTVLNVVDPGIGKSRAKALYEVVETELYLAFHPKSPLDPAKLRVMVEQEVIRLQEVLRIMTILGASVGFETLLVQATRALIILLGVIVQHLERGERDEEWGRPENWAMLELCKLDNKPVSSTPSPVSPVSASHEPATHEPTSPIPLNIPATATTEISASPKQPTSSDVPSPVPSPVSFGAAEHLTELKISMLQSRLKVEKLKEQMAKMQASLTTPEAATSPEVKSAIAIENSATPALGSVDVPATESISVNPEAKKKKTPQEILEDLLKGENLL